MTPASREDGILVIGASLGGLSAIPRILSRLPMPCPIPVAISHHRHAEGTGDLARILSDRCLRPVHDARDGERWKTTKIVLAPMDYHLLAERSGPALSLDPPVCFARPSIDVLFTSAARTFQERTIGVLLTGASADGARGMRAIRERGGLTIAQEPVTCESPVAPQAAIDAHAVSHILPLHHIAAFLAKLLERRT